jgi:hypothetical protein
MFSPDLAPSDFYLFGATKWKLSGSEFGSAGELVNEVPDIAVLISHGYNG